MTIGQNGRGNTEIEREILTEHPARGESCVLQRDRNHSRYYDASERQMKQAGASADQLLLALLAQRSAPLPAVQRVFEALSRIDVHLPVDALPAWAARASGLRIIAGSEMFAAPATRALS